MENFQILPLESLKSFTQSNVITTNHDIIFITSGSAQPNGDPITNEQRVDELTGSIQASKESFLTILRSSLVRDKTESVYMHYDSTTREYGMKKDPKGEISGSSARHYELSETTLKGKGVDTKTCIDIAGSGAVITVKADKPATKTKAPAKGKAKDEVEAQEDVDTAGSDGAEEASTQRNYTGAFQMRKLNTALLNTTPRPVQNTTRFPSKISKNQGSIGTTDYVDFFIMPYVAAVPAAACRVNGFTKLGLAKYLGGAWLGMLTHRTTTKSSTPVVVVDIEYFASTTTDNVGKLISVKLNGSLQSVDDVRDLDDVTFDFSKLIAFSNNPRVKTIHWYSENSEICNQLSVLGNKFKKMLMTDYTSGDAADTVTTIESL